MISWATVERPARLGLDEYAHPLDAIDIGVVPNSTNQDREEIGVLL
jgi:hypothetical protein